MKKVTALLLLLCMLLSFPANAASISDFSDVSQGDWFYSAVSFVTQNGMFNGTSSSSFSPLDTMTRGMFVTVLGRYGGVSATVSSMNTGIVSGSDVNMRSAPTTVDAEILACLQAGTHVTVYELVDDSTANGYTWYKVSYDGQTGYIRSDLMDAALNSFSDVAEGSYYEPYIIWACSSFVASPTGSSTFSPDRAITREEICSMLFNFATLKNYQLKPTTAAKTFSDSSNISYEYAEAVTALQRTGVITGYTNGSFAPKGSATRAEVSTMLMRFVDAISYHPVTDPSIDDYGNYIFGTEVPKSASVGADYFGDAAFIGHSLVVGMKNYSGISNADYYAINGASTTSLLKYTGFPLSGTHTDADGNEVQNIGSLSEALNEKNYGKVYIMLGVNEIGGGSYHQQNFYNNMSALISTVRQSQPSAAIYLISTTPVSQKCSESRKDINRDNLIAFNDTIKQLCRDKSLYYLNVFDLLADSNGYLPKSYCMSDGIHILSPQYRQIKDYLCTHTAP